MKVGLVTITELDNFGNRLQNYALQQVLQELGHSVETIPNLIIYKKRKIPLYRIIQKVYGVLQWLVKKDRRILSDLKKQARFKKFDSQFFRFSEKYSTIDYISEDLDGCYDVFIAGSDQIWNSYFVFNYEFNFLRFAQPYKRISYAASFGTDHVKEEFVEIFAQYLSDMAYISVRELSGKKIVEKLTDKTAEVVLDPTMLLSAEWWSTMEKKPDWAIEGQYILTYYLGEVRDRNTIFELLFNTNEAFKYFQIIDVFDPNIPEQYSITPDEFLWLIHHAAVMITDSFHGTVFSILFGTPFYSSRRIDHNVSMQSRIDSLFDLLGIEKDDLITDVKKQPDIYDRIEKYRSLSLAYLKKALDSVEEKTRQNKNNGRTASAE